MRTDFEPREAWVIKISILYPNNKNVRFDMGYYIEKHMPLAIKLLSVHPGFKGVSVERGLGGAAPGTDAAYVAMCHFLFDSVENFGAALSPTRVYFKVIYRTTQTQHQLFSSAKFSCTR